MVVQSWLNGEVDPTPPTTDAEWQSLVQHLALVHTITPDTTDVQLSPAILDARNVAEGKAMVRTETTRIPPEEQPDSLQALVNQLEQTDFYDWREASTALCRIDSNLTMLN